jgi:pimeloyl-ACP methyl ester carboxylesterase
LDVLAEQVEQIRMERKIEKWHVVGHDAGSAVAVHYAYRFQKHVDHLVLLSPAIFPELKPFHLFRLIRIPAVGEPLAPVISAIFWKIVMRMALSNRKAECDVFVEDFRVPFVGLLGAWRLMPVLRFGDPAVVLSCIPAMLPHRRIPTLISRAPRTKPCRKDSLNAQVH